MNDEGSSGLKDSPGAKTLKDSPTAIGLVAEWHMFWEGLSSEEKSDKQDDADFAQFKVSDLPAFEGKSFGEITRNLSKERQKINQQLEKLNKEIDLVTAKVESLRVVGGEVEDCVQRISELTDQGAFLAGQLEKLDEKLKVVRNHKSDFNKNDSI